MSSDDSQIRPDETSDGAEIVRSNPLQLRQLRLMAIAVGLGAVAVWFLFRYWQHHANAYDVLHRMYGICYVAGLVLLAVAVHSLRYARRILAAGQYPPPGGWILGDTRVLRGDKARARARAIMACALALAVLGGYALYLPHSISTMLMPGSAPIQVELPSIDPRHRAPPAKPHG